ncbi:glycosyltransferase [Streptomyces aureus]|uniref:glycosyltransferase n=1 Tax=Streptomyces aureus TaxID=193461 RepID=UPI000AF4347F|nr:glycosyltransferase [Streptomyces aureus]
MTELRAAFHGRSPLVADPTAEGDPPPPGARRSLGAAVRSGVTAVFPRDPLLRNGHLLAISSLVSAALGSIFWLLATHWYDDAVVGVSYSALSMTLLLASIGQLNLSDFLVRFVPSAGHHTRRLILLCYAVSAVVSALVAMAFLLLVPAVAPGLGFLLTPVTAACFVAATAGYAVFVMQDGALTAVRRPGWVVGENVIFACVKIGLLGMGAALALFSGILLSWVGALAVSLVVANFVLLRRAVPEHVRVSKEAERPDRALRYAAADYFGSLFRMAAYTVPPLMVLNNLGADQSAYFSLAWIVGYTLYLVARNLGSSLVVEAVRSPERLVEHTLRMLRHTGLLLGAGIVFVAALAPQILQFFGPEYAEHGSTLLRLLALSALPNILVSMAIDVWRARRRLRWAVGVQIVMCVMVLGLTKVLLPTLGITGAGVAWLVTMCLLAAPLLIWRSRWLTTGSQEVPVNTETEKAADTSTAAETGAGAGPGTATGTDTGPGSRPVPTLTVVVCAYTLDRWDDVRAAIGSLRAQRSPVTETVLVVDHCRELYERSRTAFPGVRVLENSERQGLSGARNTGVAAARCEVVAFLDDDAAADPDWSARLLARYADRAVVGVGGLVRPWWVTRRPVWFPREFDWVVGCSYRGLPEQPAPVRNFIGANMSFRLSEVIAAGGFRNDLGRVGKRPLGCEETELCLRIAARSPDAVLLHEPAAAVRHRVPAARTTWAYFVARCYAEGLSKAHVARLGSTRTALSSERAYVRSTVPRAFVRALTSGRPGGLRTASALVGGVGVTVAGYVVGRVRRPAPASGADRSAAGAPAAAPAAGRAGGAGGGLS